MSNLPEDIKKLEERIKKAEEKTFKKNDSKKNEVSSSMGLGIRVITDLLSALLIGGCMGYFLDNVFNTKPMMLIFLLLCGAAAGFLNTYRSLKHKTDDKEL